MILTVLDRELYQQEIDNIKLELGAPLLYIELTDEQILYNLLKAFTTLNTYRGVILPSLYFFKYEEGGVVLPFVVSNSILEIYRVANLSDKKLEGIFLQQFAGGLSYYLNLQLMARLFQSIGGGFTNFEQLAISGRWLGMLREIFGPQHTVLYRILDQKLVISNGKANDEYVIIFNDFINAKYLQKHFLYDYFWVISYAKALCKILLGEIRTKVQFSAVFGDTSFQVKAAEMMSEGQAEAEKLLNDLLERRTPYDFLIDFLE